MTMRITSDKTLCCSTAMCMSFAPEYFALDPADRRVMVLKEEPDPADVDDVEDAVDSCPTGALALADDARY